MFSDSAFSRVLGRGSAMDGSAAKTTHAAAEALEAAVARLRFTLQSLKAAATRESAGEPLEPAARRSPAEPLPEALEAPFALPLTSLRAEALTGALLSALAALARRRLLLSALAALARRRLLLGILAARALLSARVLAARAAGRRLRGRRPLLALRARVLRARVLRVRVHGLPPVAAAVPLLPRPVLILVDVAVVGGVDVVVLIVRRDLGIGTRVDRRALVAVRDGGLAPAIVDVAVVVVVGGLVHVDVRGRRAAAAAPHRGGGHRAHHEAGRGAPRERRAGTVGRRRRIPHGADPGRVDHAGAVDNDAVRCDDGTQVPRRVSDVDDRRRGAVHAYVGDVVQRRGYRNGVDDRGHAGRDRPRPGGRGRHEPDPVVERVVRLRVDADDRRGRVGRVDERRPRDRPPLG